MSLNRTNDARADLNSAEALRPRDPAIPFMRGTLYAQSGQLDGAIADFSRALELDSSHRASFTERGLVYLKLGQAGPAKKDFESALRLNPNDAGARRGLGVLDE
jgi:lipoprotein NlpI